MIRRLIGLTVLVSTGTAFAAQDHAAIEVLTPNFQVVAVGEERAAVEAAQYLETLDRRFRALGFQPAPLPSPRVRVLLLSNPATLAHYDAVPERMPRHSGLFVPGVDHAWIVSVQHLSGDPRTVLAHEYVHRIFKGKQWPRWLKEGVAEYLSRMRVVSGGVEFGFFGDLDQKARADRRSLREGSRIDVAGLLNEFPAPSRALKPDLRTQARLLVHWLATEGFDLRQLDREEVESHIERTGTTRIEAALRNLLKHSRIVTNLPWQTGEPPGSSEDPQVRQPQVRQLTAAELSFVEAERFREAKQFMKGQRELTALGRLFPDRPEPFESLGALEMDRRRYEAAERAFAAAVRNGSRSARTHYRYSLLLQRPVESAAPERADAAVDHAERARQLDPTQRLYLLTEAQARMAAGQWERAFRLFNELSRDPAWAAKARDELTELARRRQQQWTAYGRERVPRLEEQFQPATSTGKVCAVTTPVLPAVPEPASALVDRQRPPWPPAGTVLIYGHIRDVECRAGEKILTLRTPRYTVRLRENAGRPATLYSKPKRLRGLECGTKGWEVNAAYRMLRGDPEVRGELVAVVF